MKLFTEQQVTDIIKLKFGSNVEHAGHPAFTSNKALGKVFGVSATRIRELYMARFKAVAAKKQPLLQRL